MLAFLNEKNNRFAYQNIISRAAYGKLHREQEGNCKFEELIKNYLSNGYDGKSFLTIGSDGRLMDGNHRIAIHLYLNIPSVKIKVLKRKSRVPCNTDWYLKAGINVQILQDIKNVFDEIQSILVKRGNTFSAAVSSQIEVQKLSFLTNILFTNKYKIYPPPPHIYLVNCYNVSGGKRNINNEGFFVQFSLPNPNYFVLSQELVSRRAFEICKIITNSSLDYAEGNFVSKNCTEGKELFDFLAPCLLKEKN